MHAMRSKTCLNNTFSQKLPSWLGACAGQRSLYMIAENESQNIELIYLRVREAMPHDAVWNEDHHHSAMVSLIGRKVGVL